MEIHRRFKAELITHKKIKQVTIQIIKGKNWHLLFLASGKKWENRSLKIAVIAKMLFVETQGMWYITRSVAVSQENL